MGENGQYKVNLPGSPSQCSSSALGNSEKIPLTHVSSSRSSFSRYSICSSVQLKKPPPEKHLSPKTAQSHRFRSSVSPSFAPQTSSLLPPSFSRPAESHPKETASQKIPSRVALPLVFIPKNNYQT